MTKDQTIKFREALEDDGSLIKAFRKGTGKSLLLFLVDNIEIIKIYNELIILKYGI